MSIRTLASRIMKEPPFRLLAKGAVKFFPFSARTRSFWDAADRPQYLAGTLYAADQAREEGVSEISVVEFGVAGGTGLLALQQHAVSVEKETGVKISVYGFDSGGGLPKFCGDYRDHPDRWRPGDYPLDQDALRKRLLSRTSLVIGDVRETVPQFVREQQRSPLGFVSVDLDLYSSSIAALQVLLLPGRKILRRTAIYLDDVDLPENHKFAGELLAVEEFNRTSPSVKIDRWRGIRSHRPFPEAAWLERMYMAHDLAAISNSVVKRGQTALPLPE